MTTTLIMAGVVLGGLLLAWLVGRMLWGAGKTPTARGAMRAAKRERWTHGQGT